MAGTSVRVSDQCSTNFGLLPSGPVPDEPLNLGLLMFIPYRAMESAVLDELRAHGHQLTISQARVFQRIGPDGSRPGELPRPRS